MFTPSEEAMKLKYNFHIIIAATTLVLPGTTWCTFTNNIIIGIIGG